ncbi:MAG: transcriptional regulator [Pseudomonadota bacterium]
MSSPYDLKALDDVIHVRARLAILSFLASVEEADFKAVREAVGATEGNLSVHLQKLEDAGFVSVTKTFVGKRPNTRLALTGAGRAALLDYLDRVEMMLESVRKLTKR